MQFYCGLNLRCRAVIAVPVEICKQSRFGVDRICAVLVWVVLEMSRGHCCCCTNVCFDLTGSAQLLCGLCLRCCGLNAVPMQT